MSVETSASPTNLMIFLIFVTPCPCVATPYCHGSSTHHWGKYNNQLVTVAIDGAMATRQQRQWIVRQQHGGNATATQRQCNSINNATATTGGGSLAALRRWQWQRQQQQWWRCNRTTTAAAEAWRRRGGDGGGGGGTGSLAVDSGSLAKEQRPQLGGSCRSRAAVATATVQAVRWRNGSGGGGGSLAAPIAAA